MLPLGGTHRLAFDEAGQLNFRYGEFLPGHANAMRFTADYEAGRRFERTYFSIGGGAIRAEGAQASERPNVAVRHPFSSGVALLEIGNAHGLSIAEIMWANEEAWRSREETVAFIDSVRDRNA